MKKTKSKKRKKATPPMPRDIAAALRRFPRVVRQKTERYRKRQKFLKKTFGKLIRELDRLEREDQRSW